MRHPTVVSSALHIEALATVAARQKILGELPRVGDYLLAVPGHICPTTIRYPGIHVIDRAGGS